MYIYEKTVNVKHYESPIESSHTSFDRLMPSANLRYDAAIEIKYLDLYTETGYLTKDWKLDQVPTVQNFQRVTGDWSISNIRSNFLSQGRLFMTDMQYHLEISTSNEKTEIWRSYFTLIDVFSSVGGLLNWITIFMVLLYNSYNQYRLMRHVILRAVIGKEGLYPEEYH